MLLNQPGAENLLGHVAKLIVDQATGEAQVDAHGDDVKTSTGSRWDDSVIRGVPDYQLACACASRYAGTRAAKAPDFAKGAEMDDDHDDVDDLELIEDSTTRDDDVSAADENAGPGFASVLLWVGMALSVVVALLAVAVGAAMLLLPKAWLPQQVDPAADIVVFKPGDPLPDPPLVLPEPPTPSPRLGSKDLTEVDERSLRGAASHYYSKGDLQSAIQCQYMAVMRTDSGRYNLACYYSRAGNVDAALYWLQIGAKDEGSDAVLTNRDGDFVELRKDPRWPQLLSYLRIYQSYWETSGISETSLVLPRDTMPEKPIPVFIGLHGVGDNARHFVDPGSYQSLADAMGVAFLAVSGTQCRGKR